MKRKMKVMMEVNMWFMKGVQMRTWIKGIKRHLVMKGQEDFDLYHIYIMLLIL